MTSGERAARRVVAVGLGLLVAPSAFADESHHRNYLVGDRAVGLGGAFTALGDDGSAAYYNPAGLADARDESLSLGASLYGFVSEERERSAGDSSRSSALVAYPTAAIWVSQLLAGELDSTGRTQAAVSILTPSSRVVRRGDSLITQLPASTVPGYSVTSLNRRELVAEDESLWAGVSFATKPTRYLSIGASLFGSLRSTVYQFYDLDFVVLEALDGSDLRSLTIPARTEIAATNLGLIANLGVRAELARGLHLGFSVFTPELALVRSGRIAVLSVQNPGGERLSVSSLESDAEWRSRRPFRFAFGLSYGERRRFALAADIAYYTAVGRHALVTLQGEEGETPLFDLQKRGVIEASLGAELHVLATLVLRAGFFTNRSAFSSCSDGAEACLGPESPLVDPTDRYGVSGALAYTLPNATVSLSFTYNTGRRLLSAADGAQLEIQSTHAALIVGGSFHFSED